LSRGTGGISPANAVGLVVANMIGVGVFTTSGFALADLGSPPFVLLAWLVGGLLALAGALCYGALARRLPESGGEYTFLSVFVSPLAGFLAGWVSLLGGFTAPIAAAGLALDLYVAALFETGLRAQWIGTLVIVICVFAHAQRMQSGLRFQSAGVLLKVVGLLAFTVFGALVLAGSREPRVGEAVRVATWSTSAFAYTLLWIWYAYSGWNAAVYVAAEVEDPARNLPRVLVGASGFVTLLYLALNAVILYAVPFDGLAGRADVAAIAAEALGGALLSRGVAALVVVALLTSISAMILTGPRVYARMADDGVFPRFFGTTTEEGAVPRRAILFQGAAAIVVLWSSGLAQLLGYVGFLLSLSAAASVLALLALRQREGGELVPIPGYPWLPAAFVAAMLAMSLAMGLRDPAAAGVALGTVAAGLPLYAWLRKPPASARAPRPKPFAPVPEKR